MREPGALEEQSGDEGRWRAATGDLIGGLGRRFMWAGLGWLDVRQRYSGSLLGSLWLTANMTLMVVCLTFVLAAPLGSRPGAYAAYVTIGLVLWSFVQTSLNEAPLAFVNAAETLRQCTVPLSIHILRLVWRNFLVFAHSAVLVPVVLALFRIMPAASAWAALPGLLLLLVALTFAALLLAILGARFRDVPQVITGGLQLLFFATPIFWLPSALPPGRVWLVQANPLFAFVDIVRTPLLGGSPAAGSWPIAACTTALVSGLGLAAFVAWRRRIVYWI
jgi:ABC-type polysaccharide/polyol phosphate export permease